MLTMQKLEAVIAAVREGREVPAEVAMGGTINNINNNLARNIKPDPNGRSSQPENINNINAKNYKGLYAKIHSDKVYLEIQSWGTDAPLIYAAVRDHGEYKVKEIHARLSKLAPSYFNPKYGPIQKQRGRLFNHEVGKLSHKRAF